MPPGDGPAAAVRSAFYACSHIWELGSAPAHSHVLTSCGIGWGPSFKPRKLWKTDFYTTQS